MVRHRRFRHLPWRMSTTVLSEAHVGSSSSPTMEVHDHESSPARCCCHQRIVRCGGARHWLGRGRGRCRRARSPVYDCAARARLMLAPANITPSVQKYCITCHNDQLRTAGVSLQGLNPGAVQGHGDVWEKVLFGCARRLCRRPAGRVRTRRPIRRSRHRSKPRSTAPPRQTPTRAGRAASAEPGRIYATPFATCWRSTSTVDGALLLPPDDTGYGFDNIADVLSVSPMLLERYLSAARKISRLAVGDPTMRPARRSTRYPSYAAPGRPDERRPAVRIARRRARSSTTSRSTASTRQDSSCSGPTHDLIRGLGEPNSSRSGLTASGSAVHGRRRRASRPRRHAQRPRGRAESGSSVMGDATLEVRVARARPGRRHRRELREEDAASPKALLQPQLWPREL